MLHLRMPRYNVPSISQFGSTGRSVIITDIKVLRTASCITGFRQISSRIQPKIVYATCSVTQEVIRVKVELFHQAPIAEPVLRLIRYWAACPKLPNASSHEVRTLRNG